MRCYIALDVGGTGIKAGAISESGQLLTPITHYPSKSTEAKDIILNHLCDIITLQTISLNNPIVLGVGLAFPGPFDYEKGICLIQNINKYDSLYGLYLGDALKDRLFLNAQFKACAAPSFSIRFANDASLYALGETLLHPELTQGRCLCLCIGTGLGSAFLEDGRLVTNSPDIPTNGWVYHVPFRDSIIDDYISARGLLQLYKECSSSIMPNVKSIADLALEGDAVAKECFNLFGERFALAISPFISSFSPTALVIGGQIAKSYVLFKHPFLETLHKTSEVSIVLSQDTSTSTILGVLKLFNS